MKHYFQLQHQRFNRHIIDFGLPLWAAYILLPLVFIGCTWYLFSKTGFATHIYVFIALSVVWNLSEKGRNDFLQSIYSKREYKRLRLIENLVIVFPFSIALLGLQHYLHVILLSGGASLLALVNSSKSLAFTLPTPFGRYPFEFTVGFRNTFFLFPCILFLMVMAISVSNFNLGLFSIVLIALVSASYLSKAESEYFVWNYSRSPRQFLWEKAKLILVNFTVLVSIVLLPLLYFFGAKWDLLLLTYLCSYVFLLLVLLAKYSAYPREMNLPQAILIALCLSFPPMLLIVLPLFYRQSIQKLQTILHD